MRAARVIRPASPADADEMGLIHVRSWQAAYQGVIAQGYLDGLDPAARAAAWRRLVEEGDPSRGGILVSVAEGGSISGLVAFGASQDDDLSRQAAGEVTSIYADPAEWGTGTGRALMAAAVAELARLGYAVAVLWVLDANARARRFYALAGWAEDGAAKTDSSRGFRLTQVRYRRALSPPSPRLAGGIVRS